MAQLVEFGGDFVGADLRRRRHEVEAPGIGRRVALLGGLEHQLQDGAVAGVLGELVVQGDLASGSTLLSAGASASAIRALRSWMARVTRSRICRSALSNCPYSTIGRAMKMPTRATSLRVSEAARRWIARRQPAWQAVA